MPIHIYKCKKCDENFETLILNKDEIIKCPRCSSQDIEKQPTVFNASSSQKKEMPSCPSSGTCPSGGICGM